MPLGFSNNCYAVLDGKDVNESNSEDSNSVVAHETSEINKRLSEAREWTGEPMPLCFIPDEVCMQFKITTLLLS